MSNADNINSLAPAAVLEQVTGGEAGQTFEFRSDVLSLGRNSDNDVMLPNESVSRHHGQIERTADGSYIIRDNQSKNGIQVNGAAITESVLHHGDMVQVGNFLFRFLNPDESPRESASAPATTNEDYGQVVDMTAKQKKPLGIRRILIYGGVVALLGYGYSQYGNDAAKTDSAKDAGAHGDEASKNDKEGADKSTTGEATAAAKNQTKIPGLEDPSLSKAEQELDKFDWNNSALKESEVYFRKGERDYLSKNYHRAIESFQTAISLDRNHELAQSYLRLAVAEAENEAKLNFEIAVKYYESLQYARAMYHFTQVIELMSHRPSDPMISQSEKYLVLCKRRLQAAELFP